MKQLRKLFLT